ncbi:MAG: hypothetical protein KC496_10020 [Anaerolineae bacterium]|nr:hypothetical protein [Anaerolineae bacterium]
MKRIFLLPMIAVLIAACQPAAQSAPTAVISEPTTVQQATTQPSPVITQRPTNAVPPTSAPPPTAIPLGNNGGNSSSGSADSTSASVGLLNNGRGLTTGSTMNNGEFEVEGYCRLINQTFGVDYDRDNWYCTLNGQRIMTLSEREFSDICRRTYSDISAFALQNGDSDQPAFRWRCYGNR